MTFPAYLAHMPGADADGISALSRAMAERLAQPKKGFLRYRRPVERLRGIRARRVDTAGPVVRIGGAEELDPDRRAVVREVMREFMPWRKGPFSVFGVEIDAEWRSERKWARLAPHLPELGGKVIADIGCNNGYYMFRMAAHDPAMVLGFEPYLQHYFAFKALNGMAGLANLHIEPFGVEEIGLFADTFDLIFLMGIIYHRISPVGMLRDLRRSLRPGGTLVVESQVIPGDDPVALFPEKTYAKVPGTFFVPTVPCLANWLLRAGFKDTRFLLAHPMSSREQRRTEWMDFESYADFIDPADPERTVEGYPAPWRAYFLAQ